MSILLVTPPVNVTGEFSALAPYELDAGMIYKCHAIRSFDELAARNIDVYKEFYANKELEYSIYQRDNELHASIITLLSAEDKYVYVPNTYMESYPGMAGIPYQRKVIFIELGLLPETININYMVPQLRDYVTKAVGVSANPRIGIVPYTGSIDHKQHIQLERTRRATIQGYTTFEEQIADLTKQKDALIKTVEDLTAIIAAHPELQG